jgi:uncharacterized protein DUF4383
MSTRAPNARAAGTAPIQKFCLLLGAVLLAVGILGFFASSSFHTGTPNLSNGGYRGKDLIIFEVNGWHNVVHILSGLFLLAMSRTPSLARTGALAFGGIYALVTIYGIIDGSDVLGLIPINTEDNVLHVILTLAALAAGLVLPRDIPGRARATTA